jgi:hypothetical protein
MSSVATSSAPDLVKDEQSSQITAFLAQFSTVVLLVAPAIAPVVAVSSALPWFRVEQIALIPIAIGYLWLLLSGLAERIRFNWIYLIAAAYCACILLSTFYGTEVLGHEFIYRDLFEIPKALFPAAFFTVGSCFALSEKWIRRAISWLGAAISLVCLYAGAQWIDLDVAYRLNAIYSGGAHDDGSLAHYRRVYSTMGNPNLLAQLMTWVIPIFLLAMLARVGNRFRNACLVVMCLVTLAMTGSRYGLIDTSVAIVLMFIFLAPFPQRRKTLAVFLVALLPIFASVVYFVAKSNPATFARFLTLSDPSQTDSFRGRVDDQWPEAKAAFLQSPVLGNGPAKSIFSDTVTDSEYLDVLKEFGIVGFVVYALYMTYPLPILLGGIRSAVRRPELEKLLPGSYLMLQVSLIMLITAFAMSIGMSTFYGEPIQGYFWLWMGIGVGMARRFEAREAALQSENALPDVRQYSYVGSEQ